MTNLELPKTQRFNLIVNWHPNPKREEELRGCLEANIRSGIFTKVVVVGAMPPSVEGIEFVRSQVNPTFADLFKVANTRTGVDDINVVANTDILFDETLLVAQHMGAWDMYALSRYEDEGGLFARSDAQDAWIYRGVCKIRKADMHMGARGCDNSLAHAAKEYGYVVSNPALSIKARHVHKIRIDNKITKVRPPYLMVPITGIRGGRCVYYTSINPFARQQEQKRAVGTWDDGYVISFNSRKEIALLEEEYPHVIFVEADNMVGGKYVRLQTVLDTYKHIKADKHVFINSDISITDTSLFSAFMDTPDFLMGVRHDINGKDEGLFRWGYDVFVFGEHHKKISIEGLDYAIGMPWWDFHLPLTMMAAGETVRVVKDMPLFTHEWHETRYDYPTWLKIGEKSRSNPVFRNRDVIDIPDLCTLNKRFIEERVKVIA